MDLSDEFRSRAQQCLALAGSALSVEGRNHWLSMAQLWYNLAHYAEDLNERPAHGTLIASLEKHTRNRQDSNT